MSALDLLELLTAASIQQDYDVSESLKHILYKSRRLSCNEEGEVNAIVNAFSSEIIDLKQEYHLQTVRALCRLLGLILVPMNQTTLYRSWLAAQALI